MSSASAVLVGIAAVLLVFAAVPAVMFMVNLRRYVAPRAAKSVEPERVAVLIPARDEERNIGACLRSVLASRGVELEVVVLDDGSTDGTAQVVRAIALEDARVRLVSGRGLPAGWNGKQHACWLLAQEAGAAVMVFLDADVRLVPDALARCVAEMKVREVVLLSGFPRLVLVGWMERMLLPLIHFVLLGLLPMGRMRKTTKPGYAAGCGQFFVAEREAYFACGGHAAIRETRHDGLRLPRLFREHGLRTDIVDVTELAEVRMYESAGAVWMGLAKNATEGLGAPSRIVPVSLLLGVGQVLPMVAALLWVGFLVSSVVVGATMDDPGAAVVVSLLLGLAVVAGYLPRLLAVRRFKQPLGSALLHPVGVVMLLAVQWYALVLQVLGRPVAWRARRYASGSGEEIS
ncbi:MAG: glycosyltransferase family 2 protein [Acidobacteriaceae bacterium]